MSDELRAHLELQSQENVRCGMSAADARYAALRNFGGVEQIKERAREQRGLLWLEYAAQDSRYAWQQMRRHPGFTSVAVLTLAFGIGATTAMFSLVHGILLKPLAFEESGQLVQLWESAKPGTTNSVSPGVFLDWTIQAKSFEGVAAFADMSANLTGMGEPERVRGVRISASGLQLLRARPLLGRTFARDEDQAGKDKVVVLAHGLWQRRFGGAPDIVGRSVQLGGQAFEIIGVLPPGFLPWEKAEMVVPYTFPASAADVRNSHSLSVLGRLGPNVSLAQAQAELDVIAARTQPLFPTWKQGWGARVVPMHEELTAPVKIPLLILLAAVGLVLLIACANVASLLLAKASVRQREMAVRAALGASRGRIIRQLLTESLFLSFAGAAAGWALAAWSVKLIAHFGVATLPRVQELRLDWNVLGFAAVIAIFTGLAFGLAPALQGSRAHVSAALKSGGRGTVGASRSRLRRGLIVAQVALALVLLIGAGLLLNSFYRLSHVSPGFKAANVLTMQLTLSGSPYADADRRAAFFSQISERLRALPGVEAVGAATLLPLTGSTYDTLVTIQGRNDAPAGGHSADFNFCTPDYFRAMGIPFLRGRIFDEHDARQKRRVVVVNETLARELFPNENPLGRLLVDGGDTWEIVGIVGDVQMRRLGARMRPMIYRPHVFGPRNAYLTLRTATMPLALAESVRGSILTLDPNLPAADVRTLEAVVAASLASFRLTAALLGIFATAALLLAAMGLYAVIAFNVAQRTHEIGVRMAIGAAGADVLRLVLRQGLTLTAVGLVFGLAAAFALARLLRSMLFEIHPADPATFAVVSLLLLIVALLACWLPARRAAKVDPMVALRSE